MQKSVLNTLIRYLDKVETEERLDPEIKSDIAKAIKELSHSLAIKDLKKIIKSVDVLSKILVTL